MSSSAHKLDGIKPKGRSAHFFYNIRQKSNVLIYGRSYCTWLVAAEMANLVVVIVVVWMIHVFLNGQFLSLVPEFIQFQTGHRADLVNPSVRWRLLKQLYVHICTRFSGNNLDI
jgi:hypothetical protein